MAIPAAPHTADGDRKFPTRLPLVTYVLALGTFLMITSEFVIAGILPEIASDLRISLGHTGLLITVFAVGMIVGSPTMTLLTLRMPKQLTLVLALVVFVIGHVILATGSHFGTLLIARFVTALAAGAFWAVSAVVANDAAGPKLGSRAQGIVGAGGSLGTVIGVPIGALLAQLVGWRGTFWAIAGAAVIATILIARFVPHTHAAGTVSLRSQFSGLRSGRLWLVLAACATTTGGVVSAYSYVSPLLTDQADVPATIVPLVLTGFGVGSLVGTVLGGRLGDRHPGLVTVITPAVSTVLLLGIGVITHQPWITTALIVILGLFGLSANGVLIHLAVRASGTSATLGSAFTVSSFNLGTAVGTAIAGATLNALGVAGPALIGAGIVALTLIPTIALALTARRGIISDRVAADAEHA